MFYHIWAWQPSLSMDVIYFSNFCSPAPGRPQIKICAVLTHRVQRRNRLKFSAFSIQQHMEVNDFAVKKSNVNVRLLLAHLSSAQDELL